MWACKRCETLNNDEQDTCALCSEPKDIVKQDQSKSSKTRLGANDAQSSQNNQYTGANERIPEKEPRKKNHLAILIGVLSVLLVAALIVIILLISKQPATQNVSRDSESGAQPTATIAPQDGAGQSVLSPSGYDHQIVIDSIYDSATDDSFRWGAAIDQTGTVWFWDQNDYVARISDITDAAAIYTAGVDWSARLYVVKKDGSVWWMEGYWENKTLQYGLQKIPGLQNIVALEILDSFDLGLFALDAAGQVWACGNGKYGVFGMGTDENQLATPAVIEGLPPIQKIQCIYNDFDPGYCMVVAQATSGEFYYWGSNLFTNGSSEHSNTSVLLDLATTSHNWSLFESLEETSHASIACLDEQGHLSIYEDTTHPTDYSELGSFKLQQGGIRSLYLLDTNGSVFGYGDYSSGISVTEDYQNTSMPSYINELSDNQSIAAIAFGGWETTALYQDGRIGIWGQYSSYVSDVRFIQDGSGGDFKLEMSSVNTNAETENNSTIQFGDVTLTVESTSDYLVRLVPTNERVERDNSYLEGMLFDSNTIHISIDDCIILNTDGTGAGLPLPGANVQLINTDTQQEWERTLGSDGEADAFTSLPSGHYRYTVSKEGYITYSSPVFELKYSEGKENDYMWISCSMIAEDGVFSNGFEIQLTDLAGNTIVSQKFDQILISPCLNDTAPFQVRSMMVLGNATNDDGRIVSEWSQDCLYTMKKGSAAIITFDDSIVWSENGIAAPYILIRAE